MPFYRNRHAALAEYEIKVMAVILTQPKNALLPMTTTFDPSIFNACSFCSSKESPSHLCVQTDHLLSKHPWDPI